jgi:hypothetical protein
MSFSDIPLRLPFDGVPDSLLFELELFFLLTTTATGIMMIRSRTKIPIPIPEASSQLVYAEEEFENDEHNLFLRFKNASSSLSFSYLS